VDGQDHEVPGTRNGPEQPRRSILSLIERKRARTSPFAPRDSDDISQPENQRRK
jgi:hypothetical protein